MSTSISTKNRVSTDHYGRPIVMSASKAEVVSPSNTQDLVAGTLYVGGAGDVTVILQDDITPITFANVNDGVFMPIMVRRVMATGTDATNIIIMR